MNFELLIIPAILTTHTKRLIISVYRRTRGQRERSRKMEKKIARYEDFGAKGDGVTDDFAAIVACHSYANEHNLEVYATDGATYYIGGAAIQATVKTSVHWGLAKFIIDDTSLESINSDIFRVISDAEQFTPEINTLRKGQKTVDFLHTGRVFVRVFNDEKKIYIRKGLNRDGGSAASDSFVVDEDGRIFGDINWDYDTITRAYAKSADDEPIVLEGGVFTTIANRAESFYNYHKRGIDITRSNVTVRGLKHLVTGEGEQGAPYTGFICVRDCYNFTIENCVLTPHKTYTTEGADPGSKVSMGTYDFNLNGTVGVTMRGITQSIDITDRVYWGIMGTNFSKEVLIEDCVISRYDAHCGVTNVTIRNTTLGHHSLNLIGFGKCIVENVQVKSYCFINLRSDYGSFFDGEVFIKNCTWYANDRCRLLINGDNSGEHDFGYECMMPQRIEIDGLTIVDNAPENERTFYLLPKYDSNFRAGKPYPYRTPELVSLKNVTISSARELELTENSELYLDTEVVCP